MKNQWTRRTLLVSCVCVVALCAHAQSAKESPLGSVEGTVAGEGIGALEGIPIVIEGAEANSRIPEVVTNENGAYKANLPPGVYTIYPEFSPGEPGYGRFRRAKFRVVPGASTIINLSAFAGFDYCSQKGERLVDLRPTDIAGPRARKLPAPNYDAYPVPQSVGEPLDLVIDYCKRETKGDLVFYKSVAVSYNDMTLYADTISLRPKDLLLQVLKGKATIIPRGESKWVTKVSSIIGSKTFIELTDGFTESVQGGAKFQHKNISFNLDIERSGRGKIFYEDRERNITLSSEGEDISFVTTEAPNKVSISGYGIVTSDKLPSLGREGGYANFTINIETYDGNRPNLHSNFSIEIPSAKGYNRSGIIPDGSIKIRREMTPPRIEIADSMN